MDSAQQAPPRQGGAAAAGKPVVIGITGCTRSGKSRLAKALQQRLAVPGSAVIGQDGFWQRAVQVTTPVGRQVISEEEPECTDSDAFVAAIQEAVGEAAAAGKGRPCVIVEGFQLVHDPRVPALLDHLFFIDLSRQECVERRSAPSGPRNPNPMTVDECENLVWPAHERYLQNKLGPLGERVCRLKSPGTSAELDTLVETVCVAAGFARPVQLKAA